MGVGGGDYSVVSVCLSIHRQKLVQSITLIIPLRYFDNTRIWLACTAGQDSVSFARMVALFAGLLSYLPWMNFIEGSLIVHSITLISFEIFWWYSVYMYIRSRWCVMCNKGCSPLLAFWVISLECTLLGNAYALNNSCTFWDMLMIFGVHVYQVKTVCHMQERSHPFVVLLNYLP